MELSRNDMLLFVERWRIYRYRIITIIMTTTITLHRQYLSMLYYIITYMILYTLLCIPTLPMCVWCINNLITNCNIGMR